MSGFFNLIKHGPKIAKTVTSPITHARNIIRSTFTKNKTNKPKIGGQEKSKKIKEAVAIKKGATKIDDKITKQYTEAKAKVRKGDLDRKDIIGGAKNKRDSKRLMKKADEFVKETLKGFKRGGRAGFNVGGSTNGNGKKGDLGMQSVIYGLDKNPNVTARDPKAKFIAAAKSDKSTKPMGKSIVKSKKEKNKRII